MNKNSKKNIFLSLIFGMMGSVTTEAVNNNDPRSEGYPSYRRFFQHPQGNQHSQYPQHYQVLQGNQHSQYSYTNVNPVPLPYDEIPMSDYSKFNCGENNSQLDSNKKSKDYNMFDILDEVEKKVDMFDILEENKEEYTLSLVVQSNAQEQESKDLPSYCPQDDPNYRYDPKEVSQSTEQIQGQIPVKNEMPKTIKTMRDFLKLESFFTQGSLNIEEYNNVNKKDLNEFFNKIKNSEGSTLKDFEYSTKNLDSILKKLKSIVEDQSTTRDPGKFEKAIKICEESQSLHVFFRNHLVQLGNSYTNSKSLLKDGNYQDISDNITKFLTLSAFDEKVISQSIALLRALRDSQHYQ